MTMDKPLNQIAQQLFCNAFNSGERYALEPDSATRLHRLTEDRKEFEAVFASLVTAPSSEPTAWEVEAGAKAVWFYEKTVDALGAQVRDLARQQSRDVLVAAAAARAQAEGE